jgi:flavin reductase (DIM6/NTAB) family NADH-FMN oxidoreductase RutF
VEAPKATVDEVAFREAIAHFATGVTVLTTTVDGRPAGMTASAVCSLSLDPILLVVCIDNRLPTHQAIESSRRFAVNVLGEGDEALAQRFARAAEDKFAGVGLLEGSDPPVLERALSCAATPGCRPLLYYRSTFGSLRDPQADFLDEAAGWDAGSVGGLGHIHVRPR